MDILFDNSESFGPGPFIKHWWKKYNDSFQLGFSSIDYFKHKVIKLNIHPTHLKKKGVQYKSVILSETDPAFKIGFSIQDEELMVTILIVKMNVICDVPMKKAFGKCYISIPTANIYPTMIDFNGGIDQRLDYREICDLSCIKDRMSDIIVDIAFIYYRDEWNNIYHITSDCSLSKRICTHRIINLYGNRLVIRSNHKSKCFMDNCLSNCKIIRVNGKELSACNLCNRYEDNFIYQCSNNHICCINCCTKISNLMELGYTDKQSIQLLFE